MKRTAFAMFFIAAAACTAPAWAQSDKVVAKVDGHDITEAEVEFAEAEIGSELAGVPQEGRRRVLVEYLIEAHLMAEAAKKAELNKGDAFKQRMDYYRLRALRDAYFEKEVRDAVPDDEAKGLYEEQVKNLPSQQEVRASHILVKTEDEAKEIAKELEGGGDFAELAKKHSQDRGGAAGGDLGYFTRGQMVKPFEEAAFSLEKGKLSDPVKTQFGWHLIKVEDKRDRQPPAFEEVKDQIKASLIQKKLRSSVQELRQGAKISFVDPELKKAADAAEAEAAKTEEAAKAEEGDAAAAADDGDKAKTE